VKGIQFLVDDTGEKKAVLIDLKKYGDLWEDLYDTILASERRNEPRGLRRPLTCTMAPFRSVEDFECENPLWRFSPYLWGRVQILFGLQQEILQGLDEGFGSVTNVDLVARSEASLWLWVLGAYETVRTMCQANSSFSLQALDTLQGLKRDLGKVRMPAAKMEYAGRGEPVTSYRSPAGLDAKNKDLLIGSPDAPVSGRALLARFYEVVTSLRQEDVLQAHSNVV
jgi:hypothetical protein